MTMRECDQLSIHDPRHRSSVRPHCQRDQLPTPSANRQPPTATANCHAQPCQLPTITIPAATERIRLLIRRRPRVSFFHPGSAGADDGEGLLRIVVFLPLLPAPAPEQEWVCGLNQGQQKYNRLHCFCIVYWLLQIFTPDIQMNFHG